MTALDTVIPLALPDEPHVVEMRRSLRDAQAALSTAVVEAFPVFMECAWFGTSVLVDRGSFALVDPDGPLADLVGDDVRLTTDDGTTVSVYVVGSQAMGTPIAVARRPFLALAPLTRDSVSVEVAVLA